MRKLAQLVAIWHRQADVTVFELARLMGASVAMIERHYGTLLDGVGADLARRLSAFEAAQNDDAERAHEH